MRVLFLLILGCAAGSLSRQAQASDQFPECTDEARHVAEATPSVAINDFGQANQTIYSLGGYSAVCIGDSVNRYHLEANVAHVRESAGGANAALIGVGLQLFPITGANELAIVPLARLGYEDFQSGRQNIIFGGGIAFVGRLTLASRTERIGACEVAIPVRQLLLYGRTDYSDRRSASSNRPTLSQQKSQLTFAASIGLDQQVGRSPWRWRAAVSHETIDGGTVNGVTALELSARPVSRDHSNYRWNFALRGSLGDHDYRGIAVAITRRFSWK
ncbi:hypothetical protein [Sphingomonas crocodyli]|uniref:Uncharacterized protein n=1 Tax=Sphingomonas crocodyli TaxID=1979270 RepID=A0A437M7E2_9SPHN|nr:hypothetical protein [Sphingomonas crocodyli]RVT93466.1 hypothetical protein EOD43_06205 [Sphingomonas crocodyli]